MGASQIITSDDVFNHILSVRKKNEDLSFRRDLLWEEQHKAFLGINKPTSINLDDETSIRTFQDYQEMRRCSGSQLARKKVGVEERTYSNGENGFKYFTEAIQPNGLYLLDEPDNSLSAELQLDLSYFLQGMARGYACQFIISTHSPFLLSMRGAKIYDLDARPMRTCRWTELANVKLYHDFFVERGKEFEQQ